MKTKKDNSSGKEDKNKSLAKNSLLIVIFFIGVILVGLLSANFISTFKVAPNLNNDLVLSEAEVTKTHESSLSEQNNLTMQNNVKIVTKIEDKCTDFISFVQDVYKLKNIVAKGEIFDVQMMELGRYEIKDSNLAEIIQKMGVNANLNRSDIFLLSEFRHLIKPLFSERDETNNTIKDFLKSLIFFRAVGERAKNIGGLDLEVFEIEQSLAKDDFANALKHLNKINSKLDKFDDFKVLLEAKVKIISLLDQLDARLLGKVDCGVVTK